MIDPHTLLVFVPIALALNLTPGADMLFCLGQGLRAGPRAGVAAAFGIAVGAFIHALAAGLGLAALLASAPLAFEAIRWTGVVYLLWLGIRALRDPVRPALPDAAPAGSPGAAFRQAVIVNLLNPKVAIFILALVPQFVDAARGSVLVQFLIFGAVLNVGGTIINALVGAYAGSIGKGLARNHALAGAMRWLTGFIFVALAAKLAFDRR